MLKPALLPGQVEHTCKHASRTTHTHNKNSQADRGRDGKKCVFIAGRRRRMPLHVPKAQQYFPPKLKRVLPSSGRGFATEPVRLRKGRQAKQCCTRNWSAGKVHESIRELFNQSMHQSILAVLLFVDSGIKHDLPSLVVFPPF